MFEEMPMRRNVVFQSIMIKVYGKQGTNMSSFVYEQNGECADEKSKRKHVVGHRFGGSLPLEE